MSAAVRIKMTDTISVLKLLKNTFIFHCVEPLIIKVKIMLHNLIAAQERRWHANIIRNFWNKKDSNLHGRKIANKLRKRW